MATVKPVPDGYHSVTPYLIVSGAAAAIEYYKKSFGAEELVRMPMGNRVGHAELQIGDSRIMLADEFPERDAKGPKSRGGTPVSILLYLADCDAVFNRALAAGGTVKNPMKDQFYGDRSGTLEDPFGHVWTISTHTEDLTPEEMMRRMKSMGG
jgi:PhnB protein